MKLSDWPIYLEKKQTKNCRSAQQVKQLWNFVYSLMFLTPGGIQTSSVKAKEMPNF